MLSERERRSVEVDMVAAGRSMLGALGPPIVVDAMIDALARADRLVRLAESDLDHDFRERLETILKAMRVVRYAHWPKRDGSADALNDAILASHFHIQGQQEVSRWVAAYYGGGVRVVYTEPAGRYTIEVEVDALTKRFGAGLVSAFFRLVAGANRITCLIHFLKLNSEGLATGTIAYDRNYQFAGVHLMGYLRELERVVEDLEKEKIEDVLLDAQPWRELLEQSKRWDDRVRRLRNDITFHLGWPDKTTPALERLAARGRRLALHEADTPHRVGLRFTGGEELLFVSSGLTLEDFRAVVEASAESWSVVYNALDAILQDLTRQCGARWPSHALTEGSDPSFPKLVSVFRDLVVVGAGKLTRLHVRAGRDMAAAESALAQEKPEGEVFRIALVPMNDAARRRVADEGIDLGASSRVLFP